MKSIYRQNVIKQNEKKILNKFFIILISLSLASTCIIDEMKSLLKVHLKPLRMHVEKLTFIRNLSRAWLQLADFASEKLQTNAT